MAFLILALIITKVVINQDKWLYYRVCYLDKPEMLVETSWLKLNSRWNTKNADSIGFSLPNYNDNDWGYERYLYVGLIKKPIGYSWFRNSFDLQADIPDDSLILQLSLIDIHAQVFLNGIKIADSCYIRNSAICCDIPKKGLLRNKHNLIAVRANALYSLHIDERILSLNDRIIRMASAAIHLYSNWKILKGDNMEWKNPAFNDSSFLPIQVPGKWEDQVYKNYDGFAWYRSTFQFKNSPNKAMFLFMGKIDDYNEVFINGTKVGGQIPDMKIKPKYTTYDALNIYQFNSSILKGNNVIAVRVLDTGLAGGIYRGPLALISIDDFYKFQKTVK